MTTLVPCTFKEVLRMLQDCYGESILLVLRACIEGQAFFIANFITNAVYFLSW